tara:strand:+ start:323 stop:538 length:216 start_codon:yes stop_codon:yes gene_type:complete
MTEQEKEETQEEPTVKDKVLGVLGHLNALEAKCVNIIYIPSTGELMLNHTTGMPRHEIVGLLEAVRDETKK